MTEEESQEIEEIKKYGESHRCPVCGKFTWPIALVKLLTTYEENSEQIIEQSWHRDCYNKSLSEHKRGNT